MKDQPEVNKISTVIRTLDSHRDILALHQKLVPPQ